MVFLCATVIALLTAGAVRAQIEGSLQRVASGAAVLVYVPLLFGFLTGIRARWGVNALLMVVAVCKSSDIVAYYAGTWLGRKKLLPAVSPNKTVAGTVGAVGGSIAAACLLSFLMPLGIMRFWHAVAYGLLIGPVSILATFPDRW